MANNALANVNSFGSQFLNPYGQTQIPQQSTATALQNPAVGSTQAPSATAPATPKQQYIQTQAQQIQPTSAPSTNSPTFGFMNGSVYNLQGQQLQAPTTTVPQQTQQPQATASPQTVNANNGVNGTTNSNGTGAYDPYNSPSYQQYLSGAVSAQQSALTNPQIQQGLVSANQGLQGLQQNYSNIIQGELANPNLSQGALTGQEAAQAQVLANQSVPFQTQINLLNQQQQQATAAAQTGLTAANTQAGYLSTLATPTPISSGQTLAQFNPSTGQTNALATVPSYAAGTNTQTGAPYTYNQITGSINPNGTNSGLGTTPPVLGQVIAPTDPYYSTLQTAAGLLASNQVGAAQNIMSGMPAAVQAQVYQMAEGQGYNSNVAAGRAAATQSNVQTAGTAATSANAAAYAASVPKVQQLNQALNNVTDLGNMTVQNAQGNNVNPFSLVPANQTVADVRGLLSSTGQNTFDSNITQLQAAIQSLYAQGGGQTPTNITNSINSLANGSLSISGLQALLSAAQSEGKTLLTNATNTAAQEYQNILNGTQGVRDNGTSLYNF